MDSSTGSILPSEKISQAYRFGAAHRCFTSTRRWLATDNRACGACCSFSADWPRFSLESDDSLDRIPRVYADHEHGRMRCSGNRCAALVGQVGISTACAIYAVRPDVCRACLPGDDSCKMARQRFNL